MTAVRDGSVRDEAVREAAPRERGVRRLIRRMMSAGRARAAMLTVAGVLFASGLAACDQVSEETKDAAALAFCSQIEVEPSEIAENPDEARLAALIIRDLAPDENIRELADQVAQDPNALDPRTQLAEYVDEKCRR